MLIPGGNNPANISWSSRCLDDIFNTFLAQQFSVFLDAFKTSWRSLRKLLIASWRDPEEISQAFSKTKNFYTENVFKTSSRHVLKICSRHILKKYWRHAFTASSRHLGDKQNVCWRYLYLRNLNLYLMNQYLTNLWRTQNALIRT